MFGQFAKRSITLITVLSLCSVTLFAKPQKADSFLGVFDIVGVDLTWLEENIGDLIATTLTQLAVIVITEGDLAFSFQAFGDYTVSVQVDPEGVQQIVKGFQSGDSTFDISTILSSLGDNVAQYVFSELTLASTLINESGEDRRDSLLPYFQEEILNDLVAEFQGEHLAFFEKLRCSLGAEEVRSYHEDEFTWDAFVGISFDPACDKEQTKDLLVKMYYYLKGEEETAAQLDSQAGQGFVTVKECVEHVTDLTPVEAPFLPPPLPEGGGISKSPSKKKSVLTVLRIKKAHAIEIIPIDRPKPLDSTGCLRYENVRPGAVLAKKITEGLSTKLESLAGADDWKKAVAILVSSMAERALAEGIDSVVQSAAASQDKDRARNQYVARKNASVNSNSRYLSGKFSDGTNDPAPSRPFPDNARAQASASSLRIVSRGSYFAQLSWIVPPEAFGYLVYQQTDSNQDGYLSEPGDDRIVEPDPFNLIATLSKETGTVAPDGSITQDYTVTSLQPFSRYRFSVIAFDIFGNRSEPIYLNQETNQIYTTSGSTPAVNITAVARNLTQPEPTFNPEIYDQGNNPDLCITENASAGGFYGWGAGYASATICFDEYEVGEYWNQPDPNAEGFVTAAPFALPMHMVGVEVNTNQLGTVMNQRLQDMRSSEKEEERKLAKKIISLLDESSLKKRYLYDGKPGNAYFDNNQLNKILVPSVMLHGAKTVTIPNSLGTQIPITGPEYTPIGAVLTVHADVTEKLVESDEEDNRFEEPSGVYLEDNPEAYFIDENGNAFINQPVDVEDVDTDSDGVPDYIEQQNGTSATDPGDFIDSDNDGVPDHVERVDGTKTNNQYDFKDSDGDGTPDYVEVRNPTVTDPGGNPTPVTPIVTSTINILAIGDSLTVGDGRRNERSFLPVIRDGLVSANYEPVFLGNQSSCDVSGVRCSATRGFRIGPDNLSGNNNIFENYDSYVKPYLNSADVILINLGTNDATSNLSEAGERLTRLVLRIQGDLRIAGKTPAILVTSLYPTLSSNQTAADINRSTQSLGSISSTDNIFYVNSGAGLSNDDYTGGVHLKESGALKVGRNWNQSIKGLFGQPSSSAGLTTQSIISGVPGSSAGIIQITPGQPTTGSTTSPNSSNQPVSDDDDDNGSDITSVPGGGYIRRPDGSLIDPYTGDPIGTEPVTVSTGPTTPSGRPGPDTGESPTPPLFPQPVFAPDAPGSSQPTLPPFQNPMFDPTPLGTTNPAPQPVTVTVTQNPLPITDLTPIDGTSSSNQTPAANDPIGEVAGSVVDIFCGIFGC